MNIYRSHNGLILGVCKGLEESLDIPAKYFRIVLLLCAILLSAWFILALYLIAALFMPVPGREGWSFRENFENLANDARVKAGSEYRELMRTLTKSRKYRDNDEKEGTGHPSAP